MGRLNMRRPFSYAWQLLYTRVTDKKTITVFFIRIFLSFLSSECQNRRINLTVFAVISVIEVFSGDLTGKVTDKTKQSAKFIRREVFGVPFNRYTSPVNSAQTFIYKALLAFRKNLR